MESLSILRNPFCGEQSVCRTVSGQCAFLSAAGGACVSLERGVASDVGGLVHVSASHASQAASRCSVLRRLDLCIFGVADSVASTADIFGDFVLAAAHFAPNSPSTERQKADGAVSVVIACGWHDASCRTPANRVLLSACRNFVRSVSACCAKRRYTKNKQIGACGGVWICADCRSDVRPAADIARAGVVASVASCGEAKHRGL